MELSRGSHVIEYAETEFDKLTKDPDIYVEPQPENAECFKRLSEKLYSSAASKNKKSKGRFLQKLLIDGFDAEQIWQQCDLLNKTALSNISLAVRGINSKGIYDAISKTHRNPPPYSQAGNKIVSENAKDAFSSSESVAEEEYAFDDDSDSPTEMEALSRNKHPTKKKKISKAEGKHALEDDSDSEGEIESLSRAEKEYGFDDDSDSSTEMDALSRNKHPTKKKKISKAEEEYALDDDSDSQGEMESLSRKKPPTKGKVANPSIVDDHFFKLSELEDFLKIEDLKEERGIEADSEGNNDIDMFQDIPSDGMEDFEEEGMKPLKSSRDLMYEDFFDDPEAEAGNENDANENDYEESMMEENYESSVDGEDSAEGINDDLGKDNNLEVHSKVSEGDKNVRKSAFELEQEKIRQKVQELEKSMAEPLPWHLTGEVDASKRPVDSLIHKETDFDSNVKEDRTVNSTLYETVEKWVTRAIRNKAYNDPERKYKPTEDVMAYKREAVLEQTKSKKSLAEVYEDDYLKKQNKQDDEENPKHKEINKMMDSLLPELYALYTHIPMPAIPEIKVISNLPAVTVEEVAPVTLNDATLLAPEEVKQKSGQIKSKTERTDTDRKRERRKKKKHQKLKEKMLEKLESQKGNPTAKVTKLEKLKTLKKLKQHKNTKIASVDDGGKIKSSKDFFSRLQDTIDSKNRTKTQNFAKKKVK